MSFDGLLNVLFSNAPLHGNDLPNIFRSGLEQLQIQPEVRSYVVTKNISRLVRYDVVENQLLAKLNIA